MTGTNINPIVTEFLVNVPDLTLEDLTHLIDSVKEEHFRRRQEKIRETLALLQELNATQEEISSVINTGKPAKAVNVAGVEKIKVAAKYRNPENPAQEWTGRGNAPAWVRDLESKGVSRESYLIQRDPAPQE